MPPSLIVIANVTESSGASAGESSDQTTGSPRVPPTEEQAEAASATPASTAAARSTDSYVASSRTRSDSGPARA
ncbi:hypothetical protein NOK12_35870 [Nocardioides sp. OK12]|nr:hypothetical protein NOK12_35870 [Nocardioides sp. OK12]